MTGTTAKAHLIDLLLDPLRGCSGLYTYRQQLIKKIMKMPAVEVKERLEHLHSIRFPGTWYSPIARRYFYDRPNGESQSLNYNLRVITRLLDCNQVKEAQ